MVLDLDFSETQDFDWEFQVFRQMVQVLNPFLFFMLSFQNNKSHNMLCMMLDRCYKRLGLIIQFVSKEKALQIASEYDHHVLLPLLVSTYNFLPSDVSVGGSSSTFYSVKSHKSL
jgi:hypothetical protein